MGTTHIGRRAFLSAATLAAAGAGGAVIGESEAQTQPDAVTTEWRNRQPGMAYRRLGRTGYMVSEVIMGGNTIAPDNYRHVEIAIDMGLNYLDTSPAYGNGRSELGYANVIKGSSKRERVFLNSKVSVFDSSRNEFYRSLYNSLADSEKKAIDRTIEELIERRRVFDSRYFGPYFSGQVDEVKNAYLSNVMEKKYGGRIDRRAEYYDRVINSVEESLRRLGTDYLDLFMCPHGANSPEETEIPEIFEAMDKLKRDGKIRFVGLSCHSDSAGVLAAAVDSGNYDAAMIAYNVVNGDFVEPTIARAYEKDVGVIAMKVARPVYPNRPKPTFVPKSRIERLNHAIPGKISVPKKAYLWALQNPNIACVNSDMSDEALVRDNLPLAGKKVGRMPDEDEEKFEYLRR